jgi:hypothetical protein
MIQLNREFLVAVVWIAFTFGGFLLLVLFLAPQAGAAGGCGGG